MADYAQLEAEGWKPRQVNWHHRPKGQLLVGVVRGEERFVISRLTSGVVLLDRGVTLGRFATAVAAKFVADQLADTVGVVHKTEGV